MGTYNLPRNVKGENRILFIFSTKSLIYTVVAAGAGLIFYFTFKWLNMTMVGIIIMALFLKDLLKEYQQVYYQEDNMIL